jgi:putative transposase
MPSRSLDLPRARSLVLRAYCQSRSPVQRKQASTPKDGQMKRARVAEEQIIGILREQEAGCKVGDLCRKAWRFGCDTLQLESEIRQQGLSETKRLRQLEDGKAKLKKILIDRRIADGRRFLWGIGGLDVAVPCGVSSEDARQISLARPAPG